MTAKTSMLSGASGAGAAFAAALMTALGKGHAVRQAREGIRVTQSALAKEAGISQCYLSQIEHELLQIPEATALRVWNALVKFDQEYRRSEILVRLENDRAIVTEKQAL